MHAIVVGAGVGGLGTALAFGRAVRLQRRRRERFPDVSRDEPLVALEVAAHG